MSDETTDCPSSEETILSLDQIREGLRDRRLYAVAKETGLSYPTLKKLSEAQDLNYTTETLRAVSKYVLSH